MNEDKKAVTGSRNVASVEVYMHDGVESYEVRSRTFADLDEARIYAMARPAFTFFIEVWDNPYAQGTRELLASEWVYKSL